ncbi:MAG TPA: PIN domain-containing protein [Bacteroidales bacterium]|nr:PIN domain-containing protein [Bacteroidales bacterium]HPS16170.1 PIN domain-containing protein [Bacteroidales bacterium]
MAKIYDITKYNPSFNENLFFDNNIWVFLFCPIANIRKDKQKVYSEFLKNARQKRSAIFINSLVISEFCNYWLQTEFKIWKKANIGKEDYKKDFILTNDFKNTVEEVKITLNKIFQIAEKNNDDFNAINIENIITEFGSCDFNDSYYIELARLKKWKIVTDDADFFKNNKSDIEIITANIPK